MTQTTEINVADIVANKAMMMRQEISKKTITKYAKDMEAGADFPPVICFEIDGQYILVDGFHRCGAYQKLGIEKIQADVRLGTIDEALLVAVRADAHEGLARSNADKEKAVKALLASGKWSRETDGFIANAAGVSRPYVLKLRKVAIQDVTVTSSNATNKATRRGADGKNYPATRSKPKAVEPPTTAAPISSHRIPLPKLTWQQLGAPAPGTEDEQDPDSPPGTTRAMAYSYKHGHVHIMPLDDKSRLQREQKVTSFITALRDLAKPVAELMKHDMDSAEFLVTLRDMKGNALAAKFDERMSAIEPLLTRLTALNAMRAKKAA